jgi:hypothetical protein
MTPNNAPAAQSAPPSRLQSFGSILIFDIAGPYIAYSQLHAHGMSDAKALVLSGILPAAGVILSVIRNRRVDVLGILVLAGIVVGSVLGLLTGSARLVLLEGSVPTALIGLAFLGSLLTSRPLIFRLITQFAGPDSPRGQEVAARWEQPGFQRAMRLFTAVFGAAYLAEALARVVIVENTSTSTALLISKVMPWAVTGVLLAWALLYRRWALARRTRLTATVAATQPDPQDPAAAQA